MEYYILAKNTLHCLYGSYFDSKNESVGTIFNYGTSLEGKISVPLTVVLDEVSNPKLNLADIIYPDPIGLGSGYIVSEKVTNLFSELSIKNTEFYPVI